MMNTSSIRRRVESLEQRMVSQAPFQINISYDVQAGVWRIVEHIEVGEQRVVELEDLRTYRIANGFDGVLMVLSAPVPDGYDLMAALDQIESAAVGAKNLTAIIV